MLIHAFVCKRGPPGTCPRYYVFLQNPPLEDNCFFRRWISVLSQVECRAGHKGGEPKCRPKVAGGATVGGKLAPAAPLGVLFLWLYLEFSPAMFNLLMRFLSFSLFEANRSPHVLPHMPWPPNPAIVMISQGVQSIESTTARSGLSRPETKLCPYITKKSLSPARPPLSLLCAQTVDKLAKNGSLVVGRRRFNPVTDRPHCSILRCTKCKRCEIHNVLNFVHESVCLRNG